MATIGNIIERKSIGINLELRGTNANTELIDGKLQLKPSIINGVTVFPQQGEWISEIINVGDNFAQYDKLISTIENDGSSYAEIYTRSSLNGINFGEWELIDSESNIQSTKHQYIQIRVVLYSAETTTNIEFDNGAYNGDYSEVVNGSVKLKSKVEFDMIKDETYSDEGELFRYLVKREDWISLNKMNVLRKV